MTRSENPLHADNGPSPADWEDMGYCPTCHAAKGYCYCGYIEEG